MHEASRGDLEERVRALCTADDSTAAAAAAVSGYGSELLGFLLGVHPGAADASDVFAETCEVILRKLPDFRWDSTLRTWMYAVARNVSRTYRRDRGRRQRREANIADSAIDRVAATVRTETLAFLRTETKDRLRELRDALPEEDRMLLIVRVDRKLSWDEVARVLREDDSDEALSPELAKKEAARLRQRFQQIKTRPREAARREGILGD